MANFTQLHLSNSPQKSDKNKKDPLSKEKALFGAGVLAIAAISGTLLLITNGCSKGSPKSASVNSEPVGPVTQNAIVPAPVVTAVQPSAAAPKPAKKRVQHKAPMATYTEPAYGVSFRYPKNYIQTDFIEPGAVTVAAIELPRASYPGTDFTSGFFSVSVNSEISQEKCEQFAFPKVEHPENEPSAVSKVKIAGKEYAMVEEFGNAAKNDPHTKYFHHFENGNCYEFGMGLNTTDADIAGLKPVNRSLVFGRLEQILASVAKVRNTKTSEVAKTQEAKAPETKVSDTKAPEVVKDAPANPMPENNKE
jgi:hypothetical protein